MKLLLAFLPIASLVLTGHSQNLVSSESWTVGSGAIGIFNTNGLASENVRELAIGPHGQQTIVWKAIPDGGANADGGWDSELFSIERNRMYRFSVWIKKTNSADGNTYFGCSSNDILTLSGNVDSNPYFWSGDLPALNKWFLLVGYVHASSDPSTSHYGGIYDGETGAKVISITDFKFSASATTASHRTYLYYDPNTADRQYFYGPEVYQTESIQPLNEFNFPTIFNGNASFGKKVGIGTTSPAGTLHVHAASPEIYLTSEVEAVIRGNGGTWLFGYGGSAGSEEISIGTRDGSGSRTLSLAAGGSGRLKILSNGNVGIGTALPNEKLTVAGTIYGKEVRVDLSVPGPDYVFEPTYELRPLDEVRSFVNERKHLPDVPSASQMEEEGIELGSMDMLLLKKIEELTLYVLELQTKLKDQEQQIQALQSK